MSKFLIVGLGNVGSEYNHTRHNIGFDVLDAFVIKNNGQYKLDRLAYVAEVKWKGRIFICIKPTTYMNLSGKAFKYWLDKEKIELENGFAKAEEIKSIFENYLETGSLSKVYKMAIEKGIKNKRGKNFRFIAIYSLAYCIPIIAADSYY